MLIASLLSGIISQIEKLSPTLVYLVVFGLVFGEAAVFIGFIFPGETAVLVAGAIASQHHVNIVVLCAIVVVAAILGDSVGYLVGKKWGHHLFTLPLLRSRRVALERALENLERRGPVYVFIGRFTAFLRAVMPGLAGMSKMRYSSFFMANAAGGLVWGVGFTLLGFFAGKALTTVEHYASIGAGALLVLVIAVVAWRHVVNKKKEAAQEAEWLRTHPEFTPDAD